MAATARRSKWLAADGPVPTGRALRGRAGRRRACARRCAGSCDAGLRIAAAPGAGATGCGTATPPHITLLFMIRSFPWVVRRAPGHSSYSRVAHLRRRAVLMQVAVGEDRGADASRVLRHEELRDRPCRQQCGRCPALANTRNRRSGLVRPRSRRRRCPMSRKRNTASGDEERAGGEAMLETQH